MYTLICHVCSANQRRKKMNLSYKCICCGSNHMPMLVKQELIKSTKGLMRLGINLSAVRIYEIHKDGNIRSEICFCLCEPYPEYVMYELPKGWRLYYDTSGIYPVYELRCLKEQSYIDALEVWIKNKDVEAFSSILLLAGYG